MSETSKFNAADLAVFAVCELIAVPLCHAGWEAIVNEEHLFRGYVALAVGLPLGLIGASFHWWKDKVPSSRDWLVKQANRWWPVALLAAFVYAAGPSIYQRALGLANAPRQYGKVTWNLEQAAQGGGFFLVMFKTADQEIRVLGFQAHGKNMENDPIHQFSGWMRSDITNSTKPIYVLGQDSDDSKIQACIPRIPTTFNETYGIPALADFDVTTFEKIGYLATDGISVATFLNAFVPFTVHLEYDGVKVERQYSRDEINKQVDLFGKIASLQSVPRVIRREDAPKPQMTPLQPLVQATPVPAMPPLRPIILPNGEPTGAAGPRN